MKISFLFLYLGCACLSACVETSSTQRGYAEARDDCRAYSENRMGLSSGTDKDTKTKLLSLFADCMGKRGWTVGAPAEKEKAQAESPKPERIIVEKPGVISYYVPPMPMAQSGNFGTDRASACAYARHAKQHSSIALEMARDCDYECKTAATANWRDACPKVNKKF